MNPNTGKFCSATESKKKLDAYYSFVKSGKFPTDPTVDECPVGFFFGINKMKELMASLEGREDIIGIRFYMARNGDLPDAFIVAVNKEGHDSPPLNDSSARTLSGGGDGNGDDGGDGTLGDPVPCPNYCH